MTEAPELWQDLSTLSKPCVPLV